MMDMIHNVIFDLGGVLLDIDLPHCMQQMEALGIDLKAFEEKTKTTGEQASANIDMKPAVMGEGMVASGVMHLYQIGGISTEHFLEGVRRHCRPDTSREDVLKAWNSCCIAIPQYRLDKVLELRQKGYRTYMLSNTNDAHWQDIKTRCFGGQEHIDKYFDRVFLSQEMRMAKPNDNIFLAVLDKIGAKAEECLFIDDSTTNVEAADALGFHTIHAHTSKTRNGKVVASPDIDWVDTIDGVIQTSTSQS